MSWSKEKDQAFVCDLFTETLLDSHHHFDLLCKWKDCFSPMAMRWYTVSARECVFKGGKRSSKCNQDGDDKNSAPCRSNPRLISMYVCKFFPIMQNANNWESWQDGKSSCRVRRAGSWELLFVCVISGRESQRRGRCIKCHRNYCPISLWITWHNSAKT